jgi:heme/copper-type cytochrome/quinol oxidase subunit 2
MANFSDLGRLLLIAGGVIVLLGLALLLVGRVPFFGRLPGDISIQRGNTTFYFPIVTCLVLSVVLTVVVNLLLFLLRRR